MHSALVIHVFEKIVSGRKAIEIVSVNLRLQPPRRRPRRLRSWRVARGTPLATDLCADRMTPALIPEALHSATGCLSPELPTPSI